MENLHFPFWYLIHNLLPFLNEVRFLVVLIGYKVLPPIFPYKRCCLVRMFTSHISLSEYCCSGSKFVLTVPSNIAGSCGMMLSLDLKSWSPILQISTSSITMLPSLGSTTLKMACMRVDLPLPVLPTTPTFFLPGNVQLMFFRTDGKCSA